MLSFRMLSNLSLLFSFVFYFLSFSFLSCLINFHFYPPYFQLVCLFSALFPLIHFGSLINFFCLPTYILVLLSFYLSQFNPHSCLSMRKCNFSRFQHMLLIICFEKCFYLWDFSLVISFYWRGIIFYDPCTFVIGLLAIANEIARYLTCMYAFGSSHCLCRQWLKSFPQNSS